MRVDTRPDGERRPVLRPPPHQRSNFASPHNGPDRPELVEYESQNRGLIEREQVIRRAHDELQILPVGRVARPPTL